MSYMIIYKIMAICFIVVSILFIITDLIWCQFDITIIFTKIIKEHKLTHLAYKTFINDEYMLKYIKQIVSEEFHRQRKKQKWKDGRELEEKELKEIAKYITLPLSLLKDKYSDNDFLTYQKNCIEYVDKQKNIIKNYYENNKYTKASECIISYLSIVEIVILMEPFASYLNTCFDQKTKMFDWKKAIDCYFSNFLTITDSFNYDTFTPEEWIKQIKEKNFMPEEWCETLLKDLQLLQKKYDVYKFSGKGYIRFCHIFTRRKI